MSGDQKRDEAEEIADLHRRLKRAEYMEMMANRHAMQCDVDVAEAAERLARREADLARLELTIRKRELELHDAQIEIDRLRAVEPS